MILGFFRGLSPQHIVRVLAKADRVEEKVKAIRSKAHDLATDAIAHRAAAIAELQKDLDLLAGIREGIRR